MGLIHLYYDYSAVAPEIRESCLKYLEYISDSSRYPNVALPMTGELFVAESLDYASINHPDGLILRQLL